MNPSHRSADVRSNQVVPIGLESEPVLSDVLARAFWDDPVMAYLIPDERSRYRRLRHFYRGALRLYATKGPCLTTADLSGVALWAEPGRWKATPRDAAVALIPTVRALGGALMRGKRLIDVVEHRHPKVPHWYLALLGTDPARQGLGVGSALIRAVTDRCDREGIPAYLESSKHDNVAYYERLGFRVTEDVTVPGGPTLWLMWREPG
ncbi:MAG: GNAT family N-acetyltransferase [Acidimicrobiales bacterium]|nr:GNAT family N-acetyltransferase [Acidimicrobiales bacterium]